jgi:hypothetical protein
MTAPARAFAIQEQDYDVSRPVLGQPLCPHEPGLGAELESFRRHPFRTPGRKLPTIAPSGRGAKMPPGRLAGA